MKCLIVFHFIFFFKLIYVLKNLRERLENAQEECESLTQNLSNFLYWTNQQLKTIANAQPVGGDLTSVQAQFEVIKVCIII